MKTVTVPRELLIELLKAAKDGYGHAGATNCPGCAAILQAAKFLAESAPKGKKR
jgi:hypothetical protein